MPFRMTEVRFIKDGVTKRIRLEQMTKKQYEEEYRGYLFCPNPKCDAKVVYASGDIYPPYFKTSPASVKDGEIYNEHIDGCYYSVEHEIEEKERLRKDPSFLISLSPDHIGHILNDAFNKQFKKDGDGEEKKAGTDEKRKTPSSFTDKNSKTKTAGVAGLATDGAKEPTEREPNVYKRDIDSINERDYDTVLCVTGFAEEMNFTPKFGYINLRSKGKRARIFFNEAFTVNNEAQYPSFGIFKRYFEQLRAKDEEVFCCCVGKITRDEYEVSVTPDYFNSFRMNNRNYYSLIRMFHDLE